MKLDRFFSKGVIVGSQVKVDTNFFRKPGEHHIGGIWKHVDLIDLSFAPPPNGYPYPSVASGVSTISDSYTIYYKFDQYIQVYPGQRRSALPSKPPRGWGLFGRASVSDGNPTPFDFFLSAGIGGDSRLGNDRGDAFGIRSPSQRKAVVRRGWIRDKKMAADFASTATFQFSMSID